MLLVLGEKGGGVSIIVIIVLGCKYSKNCVIYRESRNFCFLRVGSRVGEGRGEGWWECVKMR